MERKTKNMFDIFFAHRLRLINVRFGNIVRLSEASKKCPV